MGELIPIQVPLANSNDTTATLVEWLAGQHAIVVAGEIVVRMETTKAVIDIDSPATGRLERRAEVGAELSVGAILGFVSVSTETTPYSVDRPEVPGYWTNTLLEEASPSEDLSDGRAVARGVPIADTGTNIRLTRRAQLLARRIGADPAALGLVGLVRARELLEAVERGPIPAEMTGAQSAEGTGDDNTQLPEARNTPQPG